MIKKEQINFGNIVIMMNKLAQSQETLRSGGGFVIEPWEWKYSSARNYCDDFEEILQIDVNR